MNCIDYMNKISFGISIAFCVLCSCTSRTGQKSSDETLQVDSLAQDTIAETVAEPVVKKITPEEIQITKELLYDKYTLEDTYPYKNTTRSFQWEKIKEQLALLENIQMQPSQWAILQNYKNRNGEAPLVKNFKRNAYGRVADTLGVERYQSVPLYLLTDTVTPERYGQDGELTRFIEDGENFVKAEPIFTEGEWMIPKILETLHHAPDVYKEADRFMEALDWIIWQMTGEETRSACCAGYKAYYHHEKGYPSKDFLLPYRMSVFFPNRLYAIQNRILRFLKLHV